MRVSGILLDAYPVPGGMRLWVALEDGRRIALLDSFPCSLAFRASTPEAEGRVLRALKRMPFPVRTRRVERTELLQGELEVVEAEVSEPLHLDALFRALRRIEGVDLYDADLDPAHRYMVARDLFPLCRVEIGHDGGTVREIHPLEDAWSPNYCLPELRVLRLRVSGTITPAPHLPLRGEIEAEEEGSTRVLCGDDPRALPEAFRSLLRRSDPDLLLTEHGDAAILPPLLRLARALRIPLSLNRDPALPVTVGRARSYWAYGRVVHRAGRVELRGRLHIDACTSFLVRECGLEGLAEAARLARMPLQRAARLSVGAILTAIQEEHALRRGILIPHRRVLPEAWRDGMDLLVGDRGGIVMTPLHGAWSGVAEIDFSAMYPTIMACRNVSAETVNCSCCAGDPDARVPGSPHRTCRKKRGLVSEVVERILLRRLRYKDLMRSASGSEREVYERRASALKWLSVVAYGYLRFRHARWGRVEAHETTTAWGREALLRAKEIAEGMGFTVVHALVDALFVHRPDLRPEEAEELARRISEATGIRAEVEAVYGWAVFCEARTLRGVGVPNRYFARRLDGTLKVRGLEVRRRDTPGIVREVQERILGILAEASSVEEVWCRVPEAMEVVEGVVRRIRSGEVRARELAVRTVLSRDPRSYRAPVPQAVAAKQLLRLGVRVDPGEEVAYIVGRGSSKVADDRAYALALVDLGMEWDYDPEWYCRAVGRAAREVLRAFRAGWK